jgi:hypothetical protein
MASESTSVVRFLAGERSLSCRPGLVPRTTGVVFVAGAWREDAGE